MINATVKLNKGDYFGKENIDFALKRLKSKIDTEEIFETVRLKRAHETPRQKQIRKGKRLAKKIKEQKAKFSKQPVK